MTVSVSVVCQSLQSYILVHFVLVVMANDNFFFSLFLAAEVETG